MIVSRIGSQESLFADTPPDANFELQNGPEKTEGKNPGAVCNDCKTVCALNGMGPSCNCAEKTRLNGKKEKSVLLPQQFSFSCVQKKEKNFALAQCAFFFLRGGGGNGSDCSFVALAGLKKKEFFFILLKERNCLASPIIKLQREGLDDSRLLYQMRNCVKWIWIVRSIV